jgi:(E)-4-hydroxy-3-methylbut-2-enyl-diphosphate synthase
MLVSCPTCGRCEISLIPLAEEVQRRLAKLPSERAITVAVMGCSVNGPGEPKDADYGVAGGHGVGLVFKHGEILRKVREEELVDTLISEIMSDSTNTE